MESGLIPKSCFRLLFLCVFVILSKQTADLGQIPDGNVQENQASDSPLVNFQVNEPILIPGPGDLKDCVYTTQLMDHVFAFSYGAPFVGRIIFHRTPFLFG